ncbi:MAG: phosphate signaling complex protein PhoU [Oscillospiraceae bacterium]|jgi:phosphate transport system protein|nr:phosphate signaling complex protein PhoU [Oscillospiraceae bacterium]
MSVRSKFDEQLEMLNISLIEMGEIVEKAIKDATKALVDKNVELAKKTVEFDNEIDDKEKEIERLCLKIILQQQPVANDLRLVSSVLKIITDLERIGDHAADISEITLLLADCRYIKELTHIPMMAEETMKMVTKSIDAFVKKDLELAKEVIVYDDIVDNLFIVVKEELTELIKENAANTDQAMDLIMVAKYFERIGDHATNIAEWVVFSLTGLHKDSRIM